jgi:tetratricopeptide (TPR) repeat protein
VGVVLGNRSLISMALLLTVAVGGGCASDPSSGGISKYMPSWFAKKNQNLPPSASSDYASTYGALQSNNPDRGLTTPGVTTKPPNPFQRFATDAADGVKGAFAKTSQKASEIVHPKSDPPPDPISLNSRKSAPGPEFYVSVARLEAKNGNPEAAVEQYKKALQMESGYLPALLGLARLYDSQGQLSEATKYYTEATAKHPRDAAAQNDLGLCLARQKHLDESAATLAKAVALQPEKVLYRNNLATVLIELGRVDEALVHLIAAHGKPVAHYNAGFLLNKRGQKEAALTQFQLALASKPDFEAAQEWVETLSSELSPSSTPVVAEDVPAGTPSTTPATTSVSTPAATATPAASPRLGPLLPPVNAPPTDSRPANSDAPGEPENAPPQQPKAPLEARRPAMPSAGIIDGVRYEGSAPPTPDQIRQYSARSSPAVGAAANVQPSGAPPSKGPSANAGSAQIDDGELQYPRSRY